MARHAVPFLTPYLLPFLATDVAAVASVARDGNRYGVSHGTDATDALLATDATACNSGKRCGPITSTYVSIPSSVTPVAVALVTPDPIAYTNPSDLD